MDINLKEFENLLIQKKYTDLEISCKNALKSNEHNIDIIKYYAAALANNQKIEAAILEYKKIIKISSDDELANFSLAKLYSILNNFSEAENYYKKSIEINKNNPEIYKTYAIFLLEKKAYDRCENLVYRARNLFKQNLDFSFLLGKLYFELKKYNDAINFFNEVDKKINNINVKKFISKSLIKLERIDEALDKLYQILDTDQNPLGVYLDIIECLKAKGDFNEAINILNDAKKKIPESLELFLLQADLQPNTISKDEIIKYQSNYQKMSKDDQINFLFALSKIYEKQSELKLFSENLKLANQLQRSLYKKYNFQDHINDVSSLLNPEIKDLYMSNVDKLDNNSLQTIIFLVGMPRSGSTLLEQILSSHSKVIGIGESDFFPNAINNFYPKSTVKNFSDTLIHNTKKKSVFKELGDFYLNQLNQKNLKKNTSKVLDKNLFNFLYVPFIKLCLPNSKFIFCKREMIDNCFSIFKVNFSERNLPWTFSINEIKSYYKVHEKICDFYKSFMGLEILEVNYENIVKNFKNEVKKILGFLNLEYEEQCEKFYETKKIVNTASQSQVRQKIYTSSINYQLLYKNFFNELF